MSKKKSDSLLFDLSLDASDLESLFDPYDPMQVDEEQEHRYPELRATIEPVDPIDWTYLDDIRKQPFFNDILRRYFRGKIVGADKIPLDGPLIVAPNHSGNAFPHDAVVLDGLMWRHNGFSKRAKLRSVFSPMLAATWWMRLYTLDNWWRRCGGVDMTFSNYDRLLAARRKVIYYPEGVPGIGKGFTRRYQLQHYHSSFVVLAARHNAPIFPVSVVNAEWVNPTSITFKWLDRVFHKVGLPFFPVPIVFLAFLFPFIFYLGFPSRMVFVIGDPIDVKPLLTEAGCTDLERPGRETVKQVAERIRVYAQQQLDRAVETYGKKPYDWQGLKAAMKQREGGLFKAIPLGWPFAFVQHDRDLQRSPARNKLHAALRDLDILAFYLPFGWFVLALLRRLRKPPYGYRGLSKQERRVREGSYRWSLKKRPLPMEEPAD